MRNRHFTERKKWSEFSQSDWNNLLVISNYLQQFKKLMYSKLRVCKKSKRYDAFVIYNDTYLDLSKIIRAGINIGRGNVIIRMHSGIRWLFNYLLRNVLVTDKKSSRTWQDIEISANKAGSKFLNATVRKICTELLYNILKSNRDTGKWTNFRSKNAWMRNVIIIPVSHIISRSNIKLLVTSNEIVLNRRVWRHYWCCQWNTLYYTISAINKVPVNPKYVWRGMGFWWKNMDKAMIEIYGNLATCWKREYTKHIVYSTKQKIYGQIAPISRAVWYDRIIKSGIFTHQVKDPYKIFSYFQVLLENNGVPFEVKRIFLKKSSNLDISAPSAIPWREGMLLKMSGYRLINYVGETNFMVLETYYQLTKHFWCAEAGQIIDIWASQRGVLHLTSSGLTNFLRQFELINRSMKNCKLVSYDVNAFFDNTNILLRPFATLRNYVDYTKVNDMVGIAVQGLYLSSWINSYSLAVILGKWAEYNQQIAIIQYVDNILIWYPEWISESEIYDELSVVIAEIGITVKLDKGFCSWVNIDRNWNELSGSVTRDNTNSSKDFWLNTGSNSWTAYNSVLTAEICNWLVTNNRVTTRLIPKAGFTIEI